MKFAVKVIAPLFALGAATGVQAADCEVTVDSNDKMRFDTDRIEMDASCEEFTVHLTHSGSMAENVMGHNWVLSLEEDMKGVVKDATGAGLENDYVKPDDERVIAYTEIIGGGEETSVTFDASELSKDASYQFFCSFPGHSSLMKGEFVVK
ncbi:azurin [Marinimicrobium locisalis]|uniref:azurin n=1 Tax=Marinimicrobium locisalis TaxID=546022 RepID=UPI003221DDAD